MSRSIAQGSGRSNAQRASLADNRSAWRAFLKRQIALSCIAVAALVTTGCHNPFKCFQYRHTSYDFVGEPNTAYYYYPKGGWAIPSHQSRHCPTTVEAPFHGFAATCWTQWPEPWNPCPPPGMCPPGYPSEVIETPHDALQAPELSPEPAEAPTPTMPLIPPDQGRRTAPPQSLATERASTSATRTDEPQPVIKPPAAAAPALVEVETPSPAPLAETAAPPKPTALSFHGRHGFSAAESIENSSAVVVELPVRKASASEPTQSKKGNTGAKQLRSYIQSAE